MPLTADCYDCRRRRAAVAGQQLVAIVDPRAAKLVTGRHWIEDDGAARLEATEKGIVERRGDCYEFRGAEKSDRPQKSSICEISLTLSVSTERGRRRVWVTRRSACEQ